MVLNDIGITGPMVCLFLMMPISSGRLKKIKSRCMLKVANRDTSSTVYQYLIHVIVLNVIGVICSINCLLMVLVSNGRL